jgi:hypothetical protein
MFVFHPVENLLLTLKSNNRCQRAADLDLCLALTAFNSDGSFTCQQAVDLDLCLALTAFNSDGSFTCQQAVDLDLCLALTAFNIDSFFLRVYACCDTGPRWFTSCAKDLLFLFVNVELIANEQSQPNIDLTWL